LTDFDFIWILIYFWVFAILTHMLLEDHDDDPDGGQT
jgi:hypothetical protein